MKKHSVVISGHATSLSLEPEFWEELKRLAVQQGLSLGDLITQIDNGRRGNLSGAIRVYVLNRLKQEIPDNKQPQ